MRGCARIRTATIRTLVRAAVILALAATAGAAEAAVTRTTITSPAGGFSVTNLDSPPAPINITGTSDGFGGDLVDIGCYIQRPDGSMFKFAIHDNVAVAGDGSFTTSASTATFSLFNCSLRAVPHGFSPGNFDDLSSFTGPAMQLAGIASNRVSGGPNNNVVKDFSVAAPQAAGEGLYKSATSCGLFTAMLTTLSATVSAPIFTCTDAYLADNGLAGAARHSEILVDGQNAYGPDAAGGLSFAAPDHLNGFPGITWSSSFAPDGSVTIQEAEDIVACSTNVFPPTAASCTSFVPTGIRLSRTIVQSEAGWRTMITDTWSSVDGHAHQVDLQTTEQVDAITPGASFSFPWLGSAFAAHSPGDQIPAPAGVPATVWVRENAAASDGDWHWPQGTFSFDTATSSIRFTSPTQLLLGSTHTVSAGGSVVMRRAYVWGADSATIRQLTTTALDPWSAPSVTIRIPSANSTTHQDRISVSGTATDNVGVARLVVNGSLVGINADGTWQTLVALNNGNNTISATADDAAGQTATATVTVNSQPAAMCVVPRLIGRSLRQATTLLRRAHCALGRVRVVRARTRRSRVIAQAIPAGWQRPGGARVDVTLLTPPRPRRRH